MSTEDGGSAENTAADFSPEGVDAQMAEMRQAEQTEAREAREAKKEPAEVADLVEEKEKPEQPRKVVPLEALHEERRARQEAQRQNAEILKTQERLAARLEELGRAPPQQIPTFEENPAAHLYHKAQQLEQKTLHYDQVTQQIAQKEQTQAVIQQAEQRIAASQAAILKEAPDFNKAVDFVRTQRTAELMAYGMDEAAAMQQANRDIYADAVKTAHNGGDAAKTFYAIARARGYTPAQAQQPAEKLESERRGVAASRSLGNGGGAGTGKLTLESLANMSDEDFSKVKDSDWRRAMGG